MGQARELMDQLTEALTTHQDPKTVANLFAEDAVAHTPDGGELHGRDDIAEYWRQMTDAMPEARYESLASFEVGDTAIDEGIFSGRNTGPLAFPDGTSIPATQKTSACAAWTSPPSGTGRSPATGSTSTSWTS